MSERIPEGFAEFTFSYLCEGDAEPMLTSVGVSLNPVPGALTYDEAMTLWNTELDDVTNDKYVMGPHYVTIGAPDEFDTVVTGTDSTEGLDATTALPPNTAVLVRKRGALGGKRNNGRMFLPGMTTDTMTANGVISNTRALEIKALLDNWVDGLVSGALADGGAIFHQTAPFTPAVWTELTVERRLATQRRRLRP